MKLVSDFSEAHSDFIELLDSPYPVFLSRVGGSDTDVIAEYSYVVRKSGPAEAADTLERIFPIVKRFNGYYDKAKNPDNMARFCDLMINSYEKCDRLSIVGAAWLTEYLPETINSLYHIDNSSTRGIISSLFNRICKHQADVVFYPYSYIERILLGRDTLFRAFQQVLPGKRVLAITPFAESIKSNFHNRENFFKDYIYPEFELCVYNTPITYEGLPEDYYPDENWFSTLDRMKGELGKIEFDIALLSCGSYAIPLGIHIRDVLKKKSVYVGGCLQLYFGIMGRRYENPFFTDQINQDSYIQPVERKNFLSHVVIKPDTAKEAFGAYF